MQRKLSKNYQAYRHYPFKIETPDKIKHWNTTKLLQTMQVQCGNVACNM
jgi:hypothetical protein